MGAAAFDGAQGWQGKQGRQARDDPVSHDFPAPRGYSLSTHGRLAVTEFVFLVEEAQEGGYTARGLGEAVFTEADTMEDLRLAVRDAVRCHFEPGAEPKVIRLHMVRDELLTT